MLNPIEKFKVAILHMNWDWNHWWWTCTYKILSINHLFSMAKKYDPKQISVYAPGCPGTFPYPVSKIGKIWRLWHPQPENRKNRPISKKLLKKDVRWLNRTITEGFCCQDKISFMALDPTCWGDSIKVEKNCLQRVLRYRKGDTK